MPDLALVEGSWLVAHGALHAGVDYFVGYPITPASGIFTEMVRAGVGLPTTDEITALQYLIGASLNGRKAMTATSGPGFLLMAEGIGAALAMEAPLVVVLVQRLGPATGSATVSAQGDVGMVGNIVSGGFRCPVLCPSSFEECAELAAHAVNVAETLRVPVILLTEKDMVVGKRTVDLSTLRLPAPVSRHRWEGPPEGFRTYDNWDEYDVPPFRALGDREVQLRLTASTHDALGNISTYSERVRASAERLFITRRLDVLPLPVLDADPGAEVLVISYGFTAYAAREAVQELRARGQRVSHLVVRTLYPLHVPEIRAACQGVRRIVIPEENATGQFRTVLLGEGVLRNLPVERLVSLNVMGRPITPDEIALAVLDAPQGGQADGPQQVVP
jgi:2-oxoglutarate ferredoxin oxidoreductase subunit alpha